MTAIERIITAGAILGLAILVLFIAVLILSKRRPDHSVTQLMNRVSLPLAVLIVSVAVLGSLYFSQIALYEPCNLCWWQRVCMFPLLIILILAWRKRDAGAKKYVYVLAGIGAVLAAYNSYLQIWPPSSQHCVLGGLVDCSTRYVFTLGFITIPFISLVSFLLIITCMLFWHPTQKSLQIEKV